MIEVRNLLVRFGELEALCIPHLDVEPGGRLAVLGTNGCGKSTLLRVLAGLLPPTDGDVRGTPAPGEAILVHQSPYFFRGTARDNVALALRWSGRPVGEADEWLERLGALSFADRAAHVLSAGERRRVALARAFSVQPSLLLLDEPLTGLDPDGRERVIPLLEAFESTLVIAAPSLDGLPLERTIDLSPTR
ncbi:MAG: energy-coupling factor ABC transporter ATP-binding protein [Planctomycetota bacterium]